MNNVLIDAKLIFMTVLLSGLGGFVLFHNHPSGTPTPSEADIRMTRRIAECASILEIALLDHIIVTDTNYYSFADHGLL